MELNDIIYGFKLERKKMIDDIGSMMYEFKHEKSGATLVYLANDDTNKCFSIGFRTLPNDSTGVCHIIEHSLLCGSKRYPTKEPFVNLLKGSMATFLNAMTAYDWTMYPVASQNDQDFVNLVSVYMDAVFAPLSVLDSKAFLQEGWHLEMNDINDIPQYKGVVYNEMKGAMSSVDEQLDQLTREALYAGTSYAYNSGGDPDVIPNLTYEDYCAFYHKHYHPSNCLMYLYGKMDLINQLKFFDEEYLSLYEKGAKITLPKATPMINRDKVKEYAINSNEDEENNTYMSLAFALDTYDNARDLLGFNILNEVLMANNEAPLKKQLLDAQLGEDIQASINDDNIIPAYNFYLHKTNPEMKDKFYETFISACQKLIEKGIDKKALLSAINHNEFSNKEMDMGRMPKGLFFAFNLMQSFNCEIPLATYLEYTQYFDYFKRELNNGYFEQLLSKYILNSKHYVQTVLLPSKTLADLKKAEMDAKMQALKLAMSDEEKQKIVAQTHELIAYQSSLDAPEDVAKLPRLKVTDINKSINYLVSEQEAINNIRFVERKMNTNQIAYLKLYFDLKKIDANDLPYVKILSRILTRLDTDEFTVNDLLSHNKMYLGGLGFDMQFASLDKDSYIANFVVHISSLNENIDKMPKILDQIINHSHYDLAKIKLILTQMKMMYRNVIIEDGMSVAIEEARATSSALGATTHYVSSVQMYEFISGLLEKIDDSIVDKFSLLIKKIFNSHHLVASLNGDDMAIEKLKDVVLTMNLSNEKLFSCLETKILEKGSTALKIPAEVCYNAKVINLKDLGYQFSGKMLVATHIINFDYLWNEVRVKGGAYGCHLSIGASGDVVLASFRDPNIVNTYSAFNGIADYLTNLNISKDEFSSYLIGAIGGFDQPMSNNSMIKADDLNLLIGNSVELREKRKQEMLDTTIEDVKDLAELFKRVANTASIYTIGNGKKIETSQLFKTIKTL